MRTALFVCGLFAASQTAASPWSARFPSQRFERRQTPQGLWPYQTFVTEPTFLPPIPEIKKYHPTAPGYLFQAPQGPLSAQNAAVIMTDDGELVWQSEPASTFPPFDFTPEVLFGKPVLLWHTAVSPPVGTGLAYSMVQILDDTYNLMYNISIVNPLQSGVIGNFTSYLDNHEAFISARNTLVVPAYNRTPIDLSPAGGPEEGWIYDCLLYEVSIPDGKIIYTWKASDHVPVSQGFAERNLLDGFGNSSDSPWDYFHMNAIQPWGDDCFVVSARNTVGVYLVNKTTDSIVWQMHGVDGGDFALDEGAHFLYQHHARLHERDGELLLSLFDNAIGLDPPFVPSPGKLLTLDLQNMTAKLKTQYVNTYENVSSQFAGNMQVVWGEQYEGFAIVGHGSQPMTEEYDLDGTLRLSWRFGPPDPNLHNPQLFNYRAWKGPWKGYPNTSPSVKACRTSGGVDVYVSWNGATEVVGWTVYGSESDGHIKELACVDKTGFETKIRLNSSVSQVQVKAKGNGHDKRFRAASSDILYVQEC